MHINTEYDYEVSRIKAFCIYNNKSYESDQHFECYLQILNEKGYNSDDIFHKDNENLLKLIEAEVVTGEISNIDNRISILIYDLKDETIINKYYNLPMYIHINAKAI